MQASVSLLCENSAEICRGNIGFDHEWLVKVGVAYDRRGGQGILELAESQLRFIVPIERSLRRRDSMQRGGYSRKALDESAIISGES